MSKELKITGNGRSIPFLLGWGKVINGKFYEYNGRVVMMNPPRTVVEWQSLYRDASRRADDAQVKVDKSRSEIEQLTCRVKWLESAAKHSDDIARKQVIYIRQLEEKLRAAGIEPPPDPLAPPPGIKVMNRIRTCTYD